MCTWRRFSVREPSLASAPPFANKIAKRKSSRINIKDHKGSTHVFLFCFLPPFLMVLPALFSALAPGKVWKTFGNLLCIAWQVCHIILSLQTAEGGSLSLSLCNVCFASSSRVDTGEFIYTSIMCRYTFIYVRINKLMPRES